MPLLSITEYLLKLGFLKSALDQPKTIFHLSAFGFRFDITVVRDLGI